MALPDEDTKFILKTLRKKLPNLFREPLEWQPDFMIVEVEKKDDSTLIEKGTQILANAKQDNAIMTTTLNTSSVRIYEPIVDRVESSFFSTSTIMKSGCHSNGSRNKFGSFLRSVFKMNFVSSSGSAISDVRPPLGIEKF
ncbi:hypothetical protein TSUD_313780 [Trifolium subterraneum]|uniref:Uncharacterized protein n=1 Tax=Trifolium subterraneum TaxID=3900 RepID=A0A2Z6M4X9_TRISU|nr:hypothetical protein TSUD_313780 [Trifolium subterraneum]